jgi:hypothetical protein
MDCLVTEDKVEYSIEKAMKHYDPAKPNGAVNLFLFLIAQRRHEEPPPQFFTFYNKYHLELEVAGLISAEELKKAMRQVGLTLVGRKLAPQLKAERKDNG